MIETKDQRFERELNAANSMLHDLALRFTKDETDAEDLYQDSVLKAYSNFDKFKDGTRFKAWMYTVMRNTWYDICDKKKRRKVDHHIHESDDLDIADLDNLDRTSTDPADIYMYELVHPTLVAALASLTEPYRTTIYLVDVRGLSYEQASNVMGTTVAAITGRLNRGRARLRAFVAETDLLQEIS